MAVDPNPSIWNSDDSQEVSAINYGTGDAGTYKTDEVGIVGTRTSDTIFTRTAGTWVVDAEIGKYIWAYIDGEYNEGAWFPVTDNDETTITITGVLTAGCNRIQISITEEHMTEYHVWNDKGKVKNSSKMICVKISARDADGGEVKNITKQHWPEIKSLTIHEGENGDLDGEVDDAMTEFQPVGLNAPLAMGGIPADCYRVIMVRVKIPNSAIEGAVTFQIYVLNQEPSTPIAKWHTELHGNGVVYRSAGAFAVSIGSPVSKLDIERGFALIDSLEAYYGAAQQYDVSELDDGIYKLYLTSVGVISATTGNIPSNSIELYRITVVSGEATVVIDKRNFIMQRVRSQHFQDLLAANASGVHAAITGNGAIQNITTAITNPDYARNTSITTTDVTSPSGDVKIVGIVRGKNDEEDITIVAGGTAYGNKAFDTVTKIVIPAGVTADDTVTVGFSDKIGLDNPIVVAGDVYKKKVNNEDKTSELSGEVSATYHTVDCATVVANEDMELRYKSILTI